MAGADRADHPRQALSTDGDGPAIEIQGLSKRYRVTKGESKLLPLLRPGKSRNQLVRDVWALRDIDLSVPPGMILGVIGPNGAGKSTLLKVLARVTPPTSGRALVRGRLVSMLELGASFQPDATGRENVLLNAALNGIPRAVARERLSDIVDFADVGEFIDMPVGRYSSGMYLRLAFSVAVNMEPDVLLADEILAVGDLAFQERCLDRIQEDGSRGLTVLFVSHDMAAIRRLCHRVIWIQHGEIVQDGDAEDVVAAYEESAWQSAGEQAVGSHRNDIAEILATELIGADGSNLGAATTTAELAIRVRLRILEPGWGVRVQLVFYALGQLVFRSVHPRIEAVGEPGLYETTVRIPAGLLSDVEYDVKTGLWLHRGDEEQTIVRRHALAFRVYDLDEQRLVEGTFNGSLAGLVRPHLEWDAVSALERSV